MQIRNKSKNIIVKVTVAILVTLFALQVINKSVYTHFHQLKDGTIISHAHPYNKTEDSKPFKSHQHSQTELYLMGSFKILFPVIFAAILLVSFNRKRELKASAVKLIPPLYIILKKGRAPPRFIISS